MKFILIMVAGISFGMWQHSAFATAFMLAALFVLAKRD